MTDRAATQTVSKFPLDWFFRDADWARKDPDLAILRGHPEFERLYPKAAAEG